MKDKNLKSMSQLATISFKRLVQMLKRRRKHLRHLSVNVGCCSDHRKRISGYRKIEATCHEVFSDNVSINWFDGQISVYAEGYVVFRYVDADTNKPYYTVLDVLYDKHIDHTVDSRTFTVNISDYNSLDAHSVILTELENKIEYNAMRRDQSKSKTPYRDDVRNKYINAYNYEYNYDPDDSYYNDDYDNPYSGNPIDTVISETTEPDNTRQEIKDFFHQKMSSLTPTQSKVLELLLEDCSQKEIAEKLGKSESAICQCKQRIFEFYQSAWNTTYPDNKVPITH